MNSLAARRRHPAAIAILLMLGLFLTGAFYAAVAPKEADATTKALPAQSIEEGRQLFLANCASCHGTGAAGGPSGPSLIGVGAASVDFQVGTGRMPMQHSGAQAREKPQQMNEEQTRQLAAYVASLGPGPAVPDEEYLDTSKGDATRGGEIFRINCAMCHNAAGAGGALTPQNTGLIQQLFRGAERGRAFGFFGGTVGLATAVGPVVGGGILALAAGEDGDVLQHGFAAIAEAWRLDRSDLQAAAQFVDHEGGERLALDILGDDQQRTARLHHLLEQGKQRLQAGELFLVDEDVRIL